MWKVNTKGPWASLTGRECQKLQAPDTQTKVPFCSCLTSETWKDSSALPAFVIGYNTLTPSGFGFSHLCLREISENQPVTHAPLPSVYLHWAQM